MALGWCLKIWLVPRETPTKVPSLEAVQRRHTSLMQASWIMCLSFKCSLCIKTLPDRSLRDPYNMQHVWDTSRRQLPASRVQVRVHEQWQQEENYIQGV